MKCNAMQLFAFNAISVRDIFECDSEQPSARSRDVGREPALRRHLLARDNKKIFLAPPPTRTNVVVDRDYMVVVPS